MDDSSSMSEWFRRTAAVDAGLDLSGLGVMTGSLVEAAEGPSRNKYWIQLESGQMCVFWTLPYAYRDRSSG